MVIGIIPARLASTRLLGKPLADIGGKPMIQHTYESALKSKLLNEVIIAVDDEKVLQVCTGFGARTLMTPKDIATGSDRIAYVAKNYPQAKIIVNIQGDEPFIKGKMIDQAIEPLLFDSSVNVSTLAKRIYDVDELKAPSIPKVVFDYHNFALANTSESITETIGAESIIIILNKSFIVSRNFFIACESTTSAGFEGVVPAVI